MATVAEGMDALIATFAAECGCVPADLTSGAVTLCQSPASEPRPALVRRYWGRKHAVAVISLGRGAVVSGRPSLLDTVRRVFAGCTRDQIFEPARLAAVDAALRPYGLQLYGPHPLLVCGSDTLRHMAPPPSVEVSVEIAPSDSRVDSLEPARWPHAVSPRRSVPTAALALARHGGELVGLAAASIDNVLLWQIGIDVAEPFWGQGIGAALTCALTRHILDAGGVPFYAAATANLPSINTALAVGFRLALIEVFTAEIGR